MSSTQSHLDNFERARLNMVESQIRAGGVTNAHILAAMADLPRENFAPPDSGVLAYAEIDTALKIGADLSHQQRYLLAPLLLARLIDALGIHEGDLVLDIGCGSGYSTAILAKLIGMGTAVGLECDAVLADQAARMLARLNLDNTVIITDRLGEGHPAQGPYDVILLSGASARPPDDIAPLFKNQLREGGRFVGVFDDGGDIKGEACLLTRQGEDMACEILFDARTPVLPGFEAKRAGFRFPGISKKMLENDGGSPQPETSESQKEGLTDNWRKDNESEASKEGSPTRAQKSSALKEAAGSDEDMISTDAPFAKRAAENSAQEKSSASLHSAVSKTSAIKSPATKKEKISSSSSAALPGLSSKDSKLPSDPLKSPPESDGLTKEERTQAKKASAPEWPNKPAMIGKTDKTSEIKSPPKIEAAQNPSAPAWPPKNAASSKPAESATGRKKSEESKNSKNQSGEEA